MAQNRVEVEIVATDEASPKIDRLEKKIDGLESDEARIIITANVDRLTEQIDTAKRKLATLDGDEASVQARLIGNLEQDLVHAKSLFDQLDGKTGTVRFRADTQQISRAKLSMDGLVESANKLPGPIGEAASLIGTGPAGLATGAGVAAGAMITLANATANNAINAQTLADLTGATVEDASRWLAIAKQTGVEYNDIADIALQVNDVLRSQPDLARKLGVNLDDGKSGLERINQLVEILNGGLFTAGERGQIMSQVFGEEGVRQIQGMVSQVGDLSEALANVPDAQIVDEADVERAREFKQHWAEIVGYVQSASNAVGEHLIPVLSEAATIVEFIHDGIAAIPGDLEGAFLDQATKGPISFWKQFWDNSIGALLEEDKKSSPIFDMITDRLTEIIVAEIEHGRAVQAQLPMRAAANRQMEEYIGWLEKRGIEAEQERKYLAAAKAHEEAITDLNTTEERLATNRESRHQQYMRLSNDEVEAIGNINEALGDMADTQDEMEANALEEILDAGRKPLTTLTNIQKINQGFRDLATFIRDDLKGVIPDLTDPMDEAADDVLSRLDGLAGDMNQAVSDEFGKNGEAAALAMANSFVNTLAAQTGMTPEEVKRLLGWEDLEIKLRVGFETSREDIANMLLDNLEAIRSSLGMDVVQPVNIRTALQTGAITAEEAIAAAQYQLSRLPGVVIQTSLGMPATEADMRRIQGEINASRQSLSLPATIQPTAVDMSRLQSALGMNFAIPPGSFTQNIINPPGTPPTTVANTIAYGRMNGNRSET